MGPGEIIDGRFEILRQAGEGGMGAVYEAIDRRDGRRVAVKLLHQGMLGDAPRFAREVRVLQRLTHPGIARYVADGWLAGGTPWLAMEWVEGETVAERLKSHEPLEVASAVALATGAARALAAAHALGIVHRDVKPGNLLFTAGDLGNPRLIDFGIARQTEMVSLTSTGEVLGTPGYIAPEQARGELDVDARADVYSLGALLYHCLTGHPPFVGATALATIVKALFEDAPRLRSLRPDLPQALDELCAAALARDRSARPRDAGELAGRLDQLDLGPAAVGVAAGSSSALTAAERVVVSVLMASASGGAEGELSRALARPELRKALGDALGGAEAQLEHLAQGALVVVLWGRGAADEARRAAQAALLLAEACPAATVALATGRGLLGSSSPMGPAVDTAAGGLAQAPPGTILVCETTAALLDTGYEVAPRGSFLVLLGKRDEDQATRQVLGRPTPFVGRSLETRALTAAYEQALADRRPVLVTVSGPEGSGKTRLRLEWARALAAAPRTPKILTLQDHGGRPAGPGGQVGTALARDWGALPRVPPEAAREGFPTRAGRRLPPDGASETLELLAHLAGIGWPETPSESMGMALADPRLLGDRLEAAFLAWLRAECAAQPVVWLVDDRARVDAPSLALLEQALRHVQGSLVVVVFGREAARIEVPGAPGARVDLHLGPLTADQCRAIVSAVLGDGGADPARERLASACEGNPFFLEELLRASRTEAAELPETVLGVVEARLAALDPDARRALRAASVFGTRFAVEGVAALCGASPEDTASWLARVAEAEVIRAVSSQTLVFRQGLFREAAYAMLTAADRAHGHRLAAAWLALEEDASSLAVASHYELGGDPARAAPWYARAASELLMRNDLDAALSASDHALRLGLDASKAGPLELTRHDIFRWQGDLTHALEAAQRAAELVEREGSAWFLATGGMVHSAAQLGLADVWRGALRALLDADQEAAPAPAGARYEGLWRAADGLAFADEWQAAESAIDRLSRLRIRVGLDPQRLGQLADLMGRRSLSMGDPALAVRRWRAALDHFQRSGDARERLKVTDNLAFAYSELGAYPEAEACLRAVLEAGQARVAGRTLALAEHNLGLLLSEMGHPQEGRRAEERAIAAFRRLGVPRLEAGAHSYLARILLALDQPAQAEEHARAGIALASQAPLVLVVCRAGLAEALLAQDRASEALEPAQAALDALSHAERMTSSRGYVQWVAVRCLRAVGRLEEAQRALIGARNELAVRAGRIQDPVLRRSFLMQVSAHAGLLAEAR